MVICVEANNLFSKFSNIKYVKKISSINKLNSKLFILNLTSFCIPVPRALLKASFAANLLA